MLFSASHSCAFVAQPPLCLNRPTLVTFSQPLMYKKIKAHKNCHEVYNKKLLAEDTIHQVRVGVHVHVVELFM